MSELLFTMADLEAAYDGGSDSVTWHARKQSIIGRSIERLKKERTQINECITKLEEEKKHDYGY